MKTNLEIIKEIGAIPKSDLQNGHHYLGICRNSNVAKWDEKEGVFFIMRKKFSSTFIEKINHPEDDNGYDLFIPYKKLPIIGEEEWDFPLGNSGDFFPQQDKNIIAASDKR